jgi:hypothetical protein
MASRKSTQEAGYAARGSRLAARGSRLRVEQLPDRLNPSSSVGIYDNNDRDGGTQYAGTPHLQEAADDYDYSYGSNDWNDIISQLQQHVAAHGQIDTLYIFDHGYSDTHRQQFGNEDIAPFRFEALQPLLAPGAVIVLAGCTVGQSPSYCQTVAAFTGATVVASDANVWFITGGTMWGDDFGSHGAWHAFDANGELSDLPIHLKTDAVMSPDGLPVASTTSDRVGEATAPRFVVTIAPPPDNRASSNASLVRLY